MVRWDPALPQDDPSETRTLGLLKDSSNALPNKLSSAHWLNPEPWGWNQTPKMIVRLSKFHRNISVTRSPSDKRLDASKVTEAGSEYMLYAYVQDFHALAISEKQGLNTWEAIQRLHAQKVWLNFRTSKEGDGLHEAEQSYIQTVIWNNWQKCEKNVLVTNRIWRRPLCSKPLQVTKKKKKENPLDASNFLKLEEVIMFQTEATLCIFLTGQNLPPWGFL